MSSEPIYPQKKASTLNDDVEETVKEVDSLVGDVCDMRRTYPSFISKLFMEEKQLRLQRITSDVKITVRGINPVDSEQEIKNIVNSLKDSDKRNEAMARCQNTGRQLDIKLKNYQELLEAFQAILNSPLATIDCPHTSDF